MPATLAYPGVYIGEFPSGVRAITGVTVGAKDKTTHYGGVSRERPKKEVM